MRAWNDWYHVNGNTYGTWLRGDARGWRARHHREHVDGDYKNPPPKGIYDQLRDRSHSLLKKEPVRLSPDARRIACDAMVASFQHSNIQVVAVCVDDHHFHLLAKFRDHRPRHWVGLAKSFSARALSDAGLVEPGGVWAVRCRCLPVRDRAHQLNIARYVAGHAYNRNSAAIWTLAHKTA